MIFVWVILFSLLFISLSKFVFEEIYSLFDYLSRFRFFLWLLFIALIIAALKSVVVFILAYIFGALFGPAIVVRRYGIGKKKFTFLQLGLAILCVLILLFTGTPNAALQGDSGFFGYAGVGFVWFLAGGIILISLNSMYLVKIASQQRNTNPHDNRENRRDESQLNGDDS